MGKQIEVLLKSIHEELLFEVYRKNVVFLKRNKDKNLPSKIKDLSFYLSVYYKSKLIRSRTISQDIFLNNKSVEDTQNKHHDFFLELKDKYNGAYYNKDEEIFCIKIANLMFFVTNGSIEASTLFAVIIASIVVTLKGFFMMKEPGNFEDVIQIANSSNNQIIKSYSAQVKEIIEGKTKHMLTRAS